MNDQTPTTEAERVLRELARSLQESQAIAGLGTYVLDLKSMTWSSSEILDQIFGIGPAYERTVEGWTALVHPEDRESMALYFNEVHAVNGRFDREYRIIRSSDHEKRWVHGLGRFEMDDSARVAV